MKINFGLREKLFAPMIVGLILIIISIFFILLPNQLAHEKESFIEQQTNLVKTLNPSIIQNILANDLSELHSVFENSILIHKDEWRYIELRNQDKKLLYPIFSSVPELSTTIIRIKITIEENDEIFGYITLYTDWKKTKNEALEDNIQLNLFAILFFCIIGLFSFFIQTKWLYKPILKLKDVTHQFSLGNYHVALPKASTDEVGLLTASIGQMRNKIQQSIDKLINEEKLQRAILDSAPNAIITIDKVGVVLSFNPGAEKIFLCRKDQIIGRNIKELMPSHFSEKHDGYLMNFAMTEESKIIGKNRELTATRKNGEEFPIDLTINAKIIDGSVIYTGVLRDITEQKKAERLKNEFVSTVSHELRTPLTAIKGALDIITHGLNLELPEQANAMLNVANRNVERLLILINDILDISKLESAEINFELEHIEIKPFLQSCAELNQEYAKKHNTEFLCTHLDDNIKINADKDRLTQVMSNLLSNAAKYSPEKIPVEIFTEVNDKTLRISVKDYGKGIPEEFQSLLFEKFTQSSSGDTRQVGGTGLGLNISKMIIEKLDGEIGFDCIVNKQTVFYFELPIVQNI